jgi:hypothetical protein
MPWKEGRCLLWDVTCPDTLAASHVDHAVTGPGVVATIAENRKRSKYAALCAAYYFVPVAIETLGALGEEATAFLKDLGSRITNHVQRVSAKHGVKDDFAFLWEHAIFRQSPNKNHLTDRSEICTIDYVGETTKRAKNG